MIFCYVCLKDFWSGGFGITKGDQQRGEASPLLSPGPHMGNKKVAGESKGLTWDDSVSLFPPKEGVTTQDTDYFSEAGHVTGAA